MLGLVFYKVDKSIFAWNVHMHCNAVSYFMLKGLLAKCPVLSPSGPLEAG